MKWCIFGKLNWYIENSSYAYIKAKEVDSENKLFI